MGADMFSAARFLVRHKVAAIAVIGLGMFALSPKAEEDAPRSPWAIQSQPQGSAGEEPGLLDDLAAEAEVALAASGVAEMVGADASLERMEGAAGAYENANAR